MRRENAYRATETSERSFCLDPDYRAASKSSWVDRGEFESNMKPKRIPLSPNTIHQHFSTTRGQCTLTTRLIFLEGWDCFHSMHTTHPFCKAVGSYASVIPPWENNMWTSKTGLCKLPTALEHSPNMGSRLLLTIFWNTSWKWTSHRFCVSGPWSSILEVLPLILPLLLTSVCKLTQ